MKINQSSNLPSIQESVAQPASESPESPKTLGNLIADSFESKSSITGGFARTDLNADAEDIKTMRDEYKSKFQEADKKQQEAQEALVQLSKALNELRLSNIKI